MTGPSWRLLRLLLLVSLVIGAVMAKRERKDKVKVDDDLTGSDDADTVVASVSWEKMTSSRSFLCQFLKLMIFLSI